MAGSLLRQTRQPSSAGLDIRTQWRPDGEHGLPPQPDSNESVPSSHTGMLSEKIQKDKRLKKDLESHDILPKMSRIV